MLRIALEIQSGIRRDVYGQKEIANAGKILRALWNSFGKETACEWVRRTFGLLQQEEILFCGLCEQGTCEGENEVTAIYGEKWKATCEEYGTRCPMCYLREIWEDVGTPQGREPFKQLSRELNKIVYELSQETAPTKTFLHCLWETAQGSRIMLDAFTTATQCGEAREGIAANAEGSVRTASGFCTEHSADSRGIGYQEERSPTLRAGVTPAIAIENHPADSRVKLDESGTVQTLTTRMGTGGGNVPMLAVPDKAYSIQDSMIGRADKNGPQGDGINENVSFTLNTTDRHAVAFACNQRDEVRDMKDKSGALQAQPGMKQQTFIATKVYGICSYASNSMKSDNPHSGICEAETSRILDQNGGSPACNQGGMAIVQCIEPGALSRGQGERVWDKCPTLRAEMGDNHPCVISCASKQYSQNIGYDCAAPLCAEDYKEPQVVATYQKITGPLMANSHPGSYTGQDAYSDMLVACPDKAHCLSKQPQLRFRDDMDTLITQSYSVRRLTPLECDRLQDYPDNWTLIPGASDSARYKADGNSIAVCCAEYVLEGIKEAINQ
jgi:DNA (cytosine-5)-methyltransferase 1